jgi:hypothetical protein
VTSIIGIGFLSFLAYSFFTKDTEGVIVCAILCVFLYIAFIRKFLRFNNVSFDSKCIYVGNKIIYLKNIDNIEKGKIIFSENGISEKVYYNYFYGKNYKLLTDFFEIEKQKQ